MQSAHAGSPSEGQDEAGEQGSHRIQGAHMQPPWTALSRHTHCALSRNEPAGPWSAFRTGRLVSRCSRLSPVCCAAREEVGTASRLCSQSNNVDMACSRSRISRQACVHGADHSKDEICRSATDRRLLQKKVHQCPADVDKWLLGRTCDADCEIMRVTCWGMCSVGRSRKTISPPPPRARARLCSLTGRTADKR